MFQNQYIKAATYGFPIIIMILLQVLSLKPLLQYDRNLIEQGEVWRLLSGNFIHYNYHHLWLNLAGLLLGMLLLAKLFSIWKWLLIMLFCALTTGLGLYFFDPDMRYYVGFSGCLHGILVVGTVKEYQRNKTIALLLLLFIISKVLWEQFIGALSPSLAQNTIIAVNAHLYGAFGGLVLALVIPGNLTNSKQMQ